MGLQGALFRQRQHDDSGEDRRERGRLDLDVFVAEVEAADRKRHHAAAAAQQLRGPEREQFRPAAARADRIEICVSGRLRA